MKRRTTFDFGCFVWTMDCVPALFVCFCFSAFSVSFFCPCFPVSIVFCFSCLFFVLSLFIWFSSVPFPSPLYLYFFWSCFVCYFGALCFCMFLDFPWFSLFCCTLPADSTWNKFTPIPLESQNSFYLSRVLFSSITTFNSTTRGTSAHRGSSYLLIRIDIPITRIPIWWCCLQLKSWSVWWWSWLQVEATNLGHM